MTAKELARLLGVSEAAVSFALNNKPGVSTETRNRIREAAQKYHLDRTRSAEAPKSAGTVYFLYYRKRGTIVADSGFFDEVVGGVEDTLALSGYRLNIINIYDTNALTEELASLSSHAAGVILLGTEMQTEDLQMLAFSGAPTVLLDNHFSSTKIDSVEINNIEGAFAAAHHLIKKTGRQPGYLRSSFRIRNFEEREEGFYRAIRYNGLSRSKSIVHDLSPTVDGAFGDMLDILSAGEDTASCYFADNDVIAVGAMRAFREKGRRIPEDVSIVGFDDIPALAYVDPGLTTVHVPKRYMGMVAAERLLSIIGAKEHYTVNIQISTHLVFRRSVI